MTGRQKGSPLSFTKREGVCKQYESLYGLAGKAEVLGVQIATGIEVTGFVADHASSAIKEVVTDKGSIVCNQLVVAPGPWAKYIWDILELPGSVNIKTNGQIQHDIPMWVYWSLQEGPLVSLLMCRGRMMVRRHRFIHVDSNAPLYSDVDGSLITDEMWGIYYKPDFHFNGIQGVAAPFKVKTRPDDVQVDPYGVDSPEFIVGPFFVTCGHRQWLIVKNVLKARFPGTMTNRQVGLVHLLLTVFLFLILSGKTVIL